jgi:hypothetical protein
MGKGTTICQFDDIEKKNRNSIEKPIENEKNSDNFRKLIAEIIVEIIIKRKKNGCDRVYKNKQERSISSLNRLPRKEYQGLL